MIKLIRSLFIFSSLIVPLFISSPLIAQNWEPMRVGGTYKIDVVTELVLACVDKEDVVEYVKWVQQIPNTFDRLSEMELVNNRYGRDCNFITGTLLKIELIYRANTDQFVIVTNRFGKYYKITKGASIIRFTNDYDFRFYAAVHNLISGTATEPNILEEAN